MNNESEVEMVTGECYDVVKRPSHYCSGGIQPKDFIRANDLNFNRGNVVKYVTRAGKKNQIKKKTLKFWERQKNIDKEIEDLKKARQYLDFEIEYLEYIKQGNSIC